MCMNWPGTRGGDKKSSDAEGTRMTSMTTADFEQLVEGHDLDATFAAGRDGRSELPSRGARWGAP